MSIGDDFFAKLKKIFSVSFENKEKFIAICNGVYHIPLTEQEIVLKDGIVKITSNQALKSKIFLIKKSLLQELQRQNIAIKDIRF